MSQPHPYSLYSLNYTRPWVKFRSIPCRVDSRSTKADNPVFSGQVAYSHVPRFSQRLIECELYRVTVALIYLPPDRYFLPASLKGEVCGNVLGAELGYQREFARAMLWPSIRGYLCHPAAWLNRSVLRAGFRKLRNLIQETSSILDELSLLLLTFSLFRIAVSPAFRPGRASENGSSTRSRGRRPSAVP